MPILNIEGFGRVEVGEDFARLPREAQDDFVRSVIAQRQGSPGAPQANSNDMAPNAGTIDRGLAQIQQGMATTARRVGEAVGSPETGNSVADFVAPDPKRLQGQSAAGAMSQDFLGNLDKIPQGIIEVLPDLAGAWASMKAGAATGALVTGGNPVGAAVGGVAGPVLFTLARSLGPYAEDAAKKNGRTTPTAEDWVRASIASGQEGLWERFGLIRSGGPVGRLAREGTSEGAAGVGGEVAVGLGTQEGVDLNPNQIATDVTLGAGARGTVDTASAVARAPGAATGALVRGAADLTRRDTVRNYDDEQVSSDLRVVEAYNRRRAAEQANTTNSQVDASVTFKGVMDDYSRALRELGGALEAGGQINREQRRLFDAAVSEGARHNREVAAEGGQDYFETLRQRLTGMGLDPQVEDTVIRAIRDLNTATYNSKYKNRRGPFESAASKIPGPLGMGPLAAITAAATANPAPLAALAARGVARRAGAALDRVAGTSAPEVLARARVVAREAQRRGLQQDNVATDLQDATFDVKARTATQQQQSQAQAAAYNQQANALGLVRGGGWAPAITSTVSNIAPGTVDIEDPIRAVEDLARMGALPRDRADALINDRTTRPTEAEMRLITDYVTTAATQVQRESWNRPSGPPGPPSGPPGPPSGPVSPNPPVTRVGNQAAYDEKMRSVAVLNDAIRAQTQGADPATQALAENVINAKSRDAKEAAFGQGTGNAQVDTLLRSAIDATSDRSGSPGRSTSVVSPEGQRNRISAARPGVSVTGMGRDPTARVSQRAGVRQGIDADGRRAKVDGKAGKGKAGTQVALKQAQADAEPMEGLPRKIKGLPYDNGPHVPAREAARRYMEDQGLPYAPPKRYVRITGDKADPGRLDVAKRVAQAFDEAKDDINDPLVAASYAKMKEETLAQWKYIKETGLKVEFNPEPDKDPYGGSPWGAIRDVRENNHLYVYPTREGFGSDETQGALNTKNSDPMEEVVPGEDWGRGIPVLVNDIFRAVHDYHGHIKEGNGFRADGEENAWRSHAPMYSPLARLAMTTETRGQNSWLNFGPYGEKNQTAKTEDTVFAAQKKAILPAWVHYEGAEDFLEPLNIEELRRQVEGSNRTKTSGPAVLSNTVPKEVGVPKLLANEGELAKSVANEHLGRSGKKGGITLRDIGAYFDGNTPRIIKPSDADIQRVISAQADEVSFQLSQAVSGENWYNSEVDASIKEAAKEIPELLTSPKLRLFSFVLGAPMSKNTNPQQEGVKSFLALELFLKDGRIPLLKPNGKKWGMGMEQPLEMTNILVDRWGLSDFVDWMFSPHTGAEIEKVRQSTGLFKGTSDLRKDQTYQGVFIYGQKFGPYALNKAGFQDFTTKDKWYVRTFNRHFGTLTGPGTVDDDGLIGQPRGNLERDRMDLMNNEVAKLVGKDPSTVQAILWFMEQRLYDAMGVKGIRSYTPLDGAKAYVEKKRNGTLYGGDNED